jgi:iron complex outermembrane receptor protein
LFQVQQAVNGGSRFNDAYGQLDASASYNLTQAARLTLEAQNLTRSVNRQYDGVATRLSNSALEDQRLYFGVALTL